jgi:PAS domain-containing protein
MKNRSHDLNLRTILDSMPWIIALVDEKARVEMINRKGAGLMAKKAQSLEGQLCGDVFNCLNAQDGNICGLSPACSQCPLRTRVISTFQTGASLTDEEGRMNLATNGYHAMEEN